jgi:hypothetical protein
MRKALESQAWQTIPVELVQQVRFDGLFLIVEEGVPALWEPVSKRLIEAAAYTPH